MESYFTVERMLKQKPRKNMKTGYGKKDYRHGAYDMSEGLAASESGQKDADKMYPPDMAESYMPLPRRRS